MRRACFGLFALSCTLYLFYLVIEVTNKRCDFEFRIILRRRHFFVEVESKVNQIGVGPPLQVTPVGINVIIDKKSVGLKWHNAQYRMCENDVIEPLKAWQLQLVGNKVLMCETFFAVKI